MPSSHFHGLDAGSVTVVIQDYPWDIRPGSIDMTVIFRDVPASTVALPPFFFRGAIFNMFINFVSSVVDAVTQPQHIRSISLSGPWSETGHWLWQDDAQAAMLSSIIKVSPFFSRGPTRSSSS